MQFEPPQLLKLEETNLSSAENNIEAAHQTWSDANEMDFPTLSTK
jgi:hypothetical protein